jgi:hypothetical protein
MACWCEGKAGVRRRRRQAGQAGRCGSGPAASLFSTARGDQERKELNHSSAILMSCRPTLNPSLPPCLLPASSRACKSAHLRARVRASMRAEDLVPLREHGEARSVGQKHWRLRQGGSERAETGDRAKSGDGGVRGGSRGRETEGRDGQGRLSDTSAPCQHAARQRHTCAAPGPAREHARPSAMTCCHS